MWSQVRWQGTDTEGLPILVIKVAKACAECQGDAAEAVSEAVVGQVRCWPAAESSELLLFVPEAMIVTKHPRFP